MKGSQKATPSMLARGRRIEIIGVPLDLGQDERGTDVGPAAIRYAKLRERLRAEGHEVVDLGNISVPPAAMVDEGSRIRVIGEVARDLRVRTQEVLQRGALPLVLGGDHSVAIGSVAASAACGSTGLLWVDAHGDFNTPQTSLSGNVHGMPLAVILGKGDELLLSVGEGGPRLSPRDVVIVGVRQLDRSERRALKDAGVQVFSMRDIDERGMSAVANEALGALDHCEHLHLSLDIDVMDPAEAPGVATPVRGGVTYRELQLLMEKIADTEALSAMDIVEVNPMLDVRNQTAKTAVDLVLSALGQSIF